MRSTRDWSPARTAAHYAAYPAEEKQARNRQAQVTYRERNRKQIKAANTARAILVRQKSYADDEAKLAEAIRVVLTEDAIAELVKHLGRRSPVGGRRQKKDRKPARPGRSG
jgi:hypothetical protein